MDRTTGRARRRAPLAALLDLLDLAVSARADRDALARGWRVTRDPVTRVHTYRDPRWDEYRAAGVVAYPATTPAGGVGPRGGGLR